MKKNQFLLIIQEKVLNVIKMENISEILSMEKDMVKEFFNGKTKQDMLVILLKTEDKVKVFFIINKVLELKVNLNSLK